VSLNAFLQVVDSPPFRPPVRENSTMDILRGKRGMALSDGSSFIFRFRIGACHLLSLPLSQPNPVRFQRPGRGAVEIRHGFAQICAGAHLAASG
jgi:hypothetical protein